MPGFEGYVHHIYKVELSSIEHLHVALVVVYGKGRYTVEMSGGVVKIVTSIADPQDLPQYLLEAGVLKKGVQLKA
ncbi:hypothetical protein NM208_g7323 [Fusarium decemcellulare]|uniref:Uncharacterized protein n=1 Tax=Fusarium decemcellulare TaxID=57161 RepID=A0ACC1SA31_9HYPO|nr:hypothetical protein NM208_g7323 [Fusarium decemcellulare]